MQPIHFFQRFSQKENVVTNNTMLLLSRLYQYSPNIFYKYLEEILPDYPNETGVLFRTQVKQQRSVPDAIISQKSFKIVIETKLKASFTLNQLQRHIKDLQQDKSDIKLLLTLSPEEFPSNISAQLSNISVPHKHISFKRLIEDLENLIDIQSDFFMILEDYKNYCYEEELLSHPENLLRAVSVGTTFKDNLRYKLYYEENNYNFSRHTFIGLYKDKEITHIAKIDKIVVVTYHQNEKFSFTSLDAQTITPEEEKNILSAMESAKKYGYNFTQNTHRFFLMEKLYPTNFQKVSVGGMRKAQYFDLQSFSATTTPNKSSLSAKEVANLLKNKTWK